MDHKVRPTKIDGEIALYCTCHRWCIFAGDLTAGEVEQIFAAHKWAWQEHDAWERLAEKIDEIERSADANPRALASKSG